MAQELIGTPPRIHMLHVPGLVAARDELVREYRKVSDLCLHLDPERRGVMSNWVSALRCARDNDMDDFRWSLVFQDDAIPLRGWVQHLERCLSAAPVPWVGLSHLGSYGRKAAAAGAPFAQGRGNVWGPCNAIATAVLPQLVAFAETAAALGYPHDDRCGAAFCSSIGVTPVIASRALFDHDNSAIKSTLGHHARHRPGLTIEQPGPAWSARPTTFSISANVSKEIPDLVRRVAAGIHPPAGSV